MTKKEPFCYVNVVKTCRNQVRIFRNQKEPEEKRVSLSPSERMSFVWELTKEVFSFSEKFNVESRLQRNVVNLIRRKG